MRILFFGNAQLTYTDTSLCVAAGFAGKNTRGNTFRLNLNTNIILEVTSSNSFRIVCTITWAGRYFHQNNAPCYGSTYRKEYFVFEVRIIMRRSRRTEVRDSFGWYWDERVWTPIWDNLGWTEEGEELSIRAFSQFNQSTCLFEIKCDLMSWGLSSLKQVASSNNFIHRCLAKTIKNRNVHFVSLKLIPIAAKHQPLKMGQH